MTEKIANAIEELETLLNIHRSALFNLTSDGWEQIDVRTQPYADALAALRAIDDDKEPKPEPEPESMVLDVDLIPPRPTSPLRHIEALQHVVTVLEERRPKEGHDRVGNWQIPLSAEEMEAIIWATNNYTLVPFYPQKTNV